MGIQWRAGALHLKIPKHIDLRNNLLAARISHLCHSAQPKGAWLTTPFGVDGMFDVNTNPLSHRADF